MTDGVAGNISEKRILFLYHNSDVIIKSTLKQLKTRGFEEKDIDTFNVFSKGSSSNDAIFSKLSEHTYDSLIIEGNLGFPGENNTNLSDPIIEKAVNQNKEINILIITSTTDCVIELFKKHAKNKKIYYIMAKGCPTESELEKLKSYTDDMRVFKNFLDFYSLHPPQAAAREESPGILKKVGRKLKRAMSSSSLK